MYPNYIEAYYRLYLLNSNNLSENQESIFQKILDNKNITLHNKSLANYLISKINKQKRNYEIELDYLKKAMLRSLILKEYNLQSNFYYENIITKKIKNIKFNNIKKIKKNLKKLKPIFIIGLPRSGSTLVETLLSFNRNVINLGENSIINMAVLKQIPNKIFYKNFNLDTFNLSLDCEILSVDIYEKIKQIKIKDNIYS